MTIIAGDADGLALLSAQRQGLAGLAMISDLELLEPGAAAPYNCLVATAPGAQVFLHVPGTVDVSAEVERLDGQIADVSADIERSGKKLGNPLGNPQFVGNAPEDIVQRERERLADSEEKLGQLRERRAALAGLV